MIAQENTYDTMSSRRREGSASDYAHVIYVTRCNHCSINIEADNDFTHATETNLPIFIFQMKAMRIITFTVN